MWETSVHASVTIKRLNVKVSAVQCIYLGMRISVLEVKLSPVCFYAGDGDSNYPQMPRSVKCSTGVLLADGCSNKTSTMQWLFFFNRNLAQIQTHSFNF